MGGREDVRDGRKLQGDWGLARSGAPGGQQAAFSCHWAVPALPQGSCLPHSLLCCTCSTLQWHQGTAEAGIVPFSSFALQHRGGESCADPLVLKWTASRRR